MLVRRSLGSSSICLRCRITQHQHNASALRTFFATPHTRFSTHPSLRWQDPLGDSSLPEVDLKRSQVFPEDDVDAKPKIRKVGGPGGTQMKTIRKTRRASNKKVLLEDSKPLDRITLGQKAEVLILRDIDVDFGHKGEATFEEADATFAKERDETRAAIEASIASQNAVVGQEEVNAAINEMKPAGGKVRRIFSNEKLEELRKALKGFLAPQLRRFVMITEDEQKLEALRRIDARMKASFENEEASSRELPKSIWKEGITPIEERLPKGTLFVEPERLKKADLIDHIIKRLWHVTTVEELDAVGEIEVEVKQWHLELVTKGFGMTVRESALDRIGNQRNVRIEVYEPENIIRFTANRTDAMRAIKDLQLELGNVGSSNFTLDPFKPMLERQGMQGILHAINQRDIEAIANFSNTNIEVSDDSLIIRATSEKNAASARRFLIDMLYLRTRTETKMFTGATGQGVLHKNLMESALPYRYRQTNLGRWGYPIQRSSATAADRSTRDAEFPIAQQDATSDVANQVTSYLLSPTGVGIPNDENTTNSEEPPQQSLWNPKITTQISAGYGNVLHSFDSKPGMSQLSAETVTTSTKSPVFLNSIPGANPFIGGIASLGTQLKPGTYGRTPDTLMFRFVPFPWHHEDAAEASEDIPKFSLRLSLSDEGQVRYSGSGLTLADRNAYVLMPDKVTDVAFNRREMLWSQGAMRDRQIRSFVQRTQESIEMKGNIRVPPTISLSIPAWSIRNIDRYPDLPKVYTEMGEERVVTYSHIGTEHRQSLRLDFDNGRFRGAMSSVEAGRLGGRRNEVRLRIRKSPETEAQMEGILGKFVENGMRVAEWLDNAVNLRLEVPPVNISRRMSKKAPELVQGKGDWQFVSIWKAYGEEQNEQPQQPKPPQGDDAETKSFGNEEGESRVFEGYVPDDVNVSLWDVGRSHDTHEAPRHIEAWGIETDKKSVQRSDRDETAFAPWDSEQDDLYSQVTAWQTPQDDDSKGVQAQDLHLDAQENPSPDPESTDAARTADGAGEASQAASSDTASTSNNEDGGQGREDQRQA
ncbi:mitochondrial inner-membrane-bound regulator-domain-containing protein [Phyllosticta citribraziliensis]|uniref:Mitochondrial inner-membrane-bound regulator-domain-containing protein n=1 Tax=Phyllosticta citribraziliensis TaxID=989973 RepID=A0ABR1L8D2_9PEZI